MREYPILFSTAMVQALMAGRKTQTRRIVKPQPPAPECSYKELLDKSPYGKPGDVLWVRETFCKGIVWDGEGPEPGYFDLIGEPRPDHLNPKFFYKADKHDFEWCREELNEDDPRYFTAKWKPSIHMPKSAARIWLQVTEIRVERLQDISQEDAGEEGVTPKPHRCEGWSNPANQIKDCFKCAFRFLWNTINGERGYSWDRNPWVWAVSFRVLSTTGRPANLEELCQGK